MQISNSPDITVLKLPVTFDLTGPDAVVKIDNLNVGSHLNLVKLVFELYDPNGQPIHIGDPLTPDALGNFVGPYIFTEPLPIFDNSIGWSGNPYKLIVKAADSVSDLPQLIQEISICKPAGNQNVGKNYAEAQLLITIDCNSGEAKIIDTTSYLYKSLTGEVVSKKLTIFSPPDDTGTPIAPVVYNGLSAVLHPITRSGKGFQAVISSKIKFDMSNGSGDAYVILNYIKHQQFDVNCNYDICPLLSEFGKLIDSAETNCDQKSIDLIAKISPKLLNLVLAKQQATCGYDIGEMIADIKETAGWDCNCDCARNVGINGVGLVGGGGLNIQFDAGGDITASADVTGANVLIHLKDYSYVFNMCAPGSAGFTIVPSINGRVKTYCLNVDKAVLANEIITTIQNNDTLLQYFNNIIQSTGQNLVLTIDGKCVVQTTPICTYSFTTPIVTGQNYILKRIDVDGVPRNYNISFSTFPGHTAGLALLLATLTNAGNFTFTLAGGVLTISSINNPHNIGAIVIQQPDGTQVNMNMVKNCNDIVPLNANQIVQAVIDYICNIKAANIGVSGTLSLCKINDDGTTVTTAYNGTLDEYLQAQAVQFCKLVNIALTKQKVSCNDIKDVFVSTKPITPLDTILGTRSAECGPWTISDLFKTIFSFISTTNDPAIKTLFCNAINICSTGGICNPVTSGSANYDGTNLNITIANTGSASYKVAYRVFGSSAPFSYAVVAAIAGPVTTVSYAAAHNRYEVSVISICVGSESVPFSFTSQSCPDMLAFNVVRSGGNFIITYTAAAGVPKVNYDIRYPNGGGVNATVVVTVPGQIIVPIPAANFGTYNFKIRSACDDITGWYGDYTNQIDYNLIAPVVGGGVIYLGDLGAAALLTQPEIEAALSTVPVTGGDVIIDWTGVLTPRFLWFAEPSTEPVKTSWIDNVNPLNTGTIGNPGDLFNAPITVGPYRFYITAYATQFINTVTLKV